MPMPSKPDPASGLILLPAVLPKGKEQEDVAKGVVDFRFSPEKLKAAKESIGITDFTRGEIRTILERAYEGLKIGDVQDNKQKVNITYEENNGLIREPATVLKNGKADCDEVTRTAYLLAWESGVRNITMIEMGWTEKTEDGERRTGHSFIVLMPQGKEEAPRIYDFTYYKKGKPITVGSEGLEYAIRREYSADAANPDFGIVTRSSLNEVEAAHYDQVGEFYDRRNWKNVTEAYERAVKLAPQELKYNLDLAVSYEKTGELKKAIEGYKKCLTPEGGKNNVKVYSYLGSAYALTSQLDEAIMYLEIARAMRPSDKLGKKVTINLINTYIQKTEELEKTGHEEEAEEYRKKANELH